MSNTNVELQAYLEQPLPDLMAELSLYDDTTRSPADTWAKIAGPLRQRICDEWDWCEVRQDARFENDYDLAMAVLAILSTGPLRTDDHLTHRFCPRFQWCPWQNH